MLRPSLLASFLRPSSRPLRRLLRPPGRWLSSLTSQMSALQHTADSFPILRANDPRFRNDFSSLDALERAMTSEPSSVQQLYTMPSVDELGQPQETRAGTRLFQTQASDSREAAVGHVLPAHGRPGMPPAQGTGTSLLGSLLATHGFLMSGPTAYSVSLLSVRLATTIALFTKNLLPPSCSFLSLPPDFSACNLTACGGCIFLFFLRTFRLSFCV